MKKNWARIVSGLAFALSALMFTGVSSASAGSQVNGAGSTYVYIAMRQWIAQGQSLGLSVNYTPQGSPTGLGLYAQQRIEFAGTEAEYASLPAPNPGRGHQYVPDVAGATAIMYNIKDGSGKQVDYLHLDAVTVARIYTGKIKTWADPAISKTNKGIKFPDKPIRVVLRGNQSGTTALFFDFIKSTLGSEYDKWFTDYECGDPKIRPVLLQCRKSGFIPSTVQFNDSEQIAQFVSSDNGAWSIGFDEFGYAKKFKTPTAWIKNASGKYVLPYAQNISAALESAKLRSDLSQDLSAVYASRNAAAYPISAYSYLVTPCAPS
ncbi:MAG: substrate-binding domain-containing protein, partial [Angustibacter sp.]